MKTLEEIIAFATEQHKGQKDKAGMPYILHPLHIMSQMDTEEEMIVAILHDVTEDTDFEVADLEEILNLPIKIVIALNYLTKKRGISYTDYIDDLKRNNLARKVKLADLRHNLDVSRIKGLTGVIEPVEKVKNRLIKYHKAKMVLTTYELEKSSY